MRASGVAIRSRPEPYRVDYRLTTGSGFVTEDLMVATDGDGWSRRLHLRRNSDGRWAADANGHGAPELAGPGGDVSQFAAALDVDLQLSPMFNTMPVLRHQLHRRPGAAHEFLMIWISLPDLALHPSPQRYSHLTRSAADRSVVRFEAIGDDFEADVIFDDAGLVVDYPGIGARLGAGV